MRIPSFSSLFVGVLAFAVVFCVTAHSQTPVSVPTWHNDNWRTGSNTHETALIPTSINGTTKFGKICTARTDGQIYAQPLVVANVTIKGKLYASVAYVASMNDSVYAFDADSTGSTCTVLLQTSLLQAGEQAAECNQVGGKGCGAFSPIVGILETPTIDTTTGTLYVVAQSQLGNPATSFFMRLHALDITTLSTTAEKFGGPVVVGNSSFAQAHWLRTGMLLLPGAAPNGDGMVYFSTEHGVKPWEHGYIYGYDAQNLQATPAVFKTTPNGVRGGIWQTGAGLAAGTDSTGGLQYLFPAISDGTFDADSSTPPNRDYGDSLLKLPAGLVPISPPSASTYFTPFNQQCISNQDADFGSGGVLLIPDKTLASHPYLAISTSKGGNMYVIDRDMPGGFNGNSNTNLQTYPNTGSLTSCNGKHPYYGATAYWNQYIYNAARGENLVRYQLSDSCTRGGPLCTDSSSIVRTAVTFLSGATPSISANATTSGIVWAIAGGGQVTGPPYAILYAFDALNTDTNGHLKGLWNSAQCHTSERDRPGYGTKFTTPTVANGRVLIGTQDPTDSTGTRGELDIYGLNPAGTCN